MGMQPLQCPFWKFSLPWVLLGVLAFSIISCEKPPKKEAKKENPEEFFKGSPEENISELKNEFAEAPTVLMRTFKDSALPWQQWDRSLLEKAKRTQKLIMLMILNPNIPSAQSALSNIEADPDFAQTLADNYVLSVADTHAFPELATTSYLLAGEIGEGISFPFVMWLSFEGSPVAWFPFGTLDGKNFTSQLEGSHLLLSNLLNESEKYVIENSRSDVDRRVESLKQRFSEMSEDQIGTIANSFKRKGRSLVALYDRGSASVDEVGGLLPSRVLMLYALQASHPAVYSGVQESAHAATVGLAKTIAFSALADPTGGYFFAQRTSTGSVPLLVKTLPSQASLASAFALAADATGEASIQKQAKELFDYLMTDWSEAVDGLESINTNLKVNKDQLFIPSIAALAKFLTPEEVTKAKAVFRLSDEGNLRNVRLPKGHIDANLLRTPRPEDFQKAGFSGSDDPGYLELCEKIVRARRDQEGTLRELVCSASTLARFGLAAIDMTIATDDVVARRTIETITEILERNYYQSQEEGPSPILLRLPKAGTRTVLARASDYSDVLTFLLRAYQLDFSPKYLQAASGLVQALDELHLQPNSISGLRLAPEEQSIIPFEVPDFAMIFSDSAGGTMIETLARTAVLKNNSGLVEKRRRFWRTAQKLAEQSVISSSDAIMASAFGDAPFQLVFDETSSGLALGDLPLRYHYFVLARPREDPTGLLAPLPAGLPGGTVLVKGGKVLGSVPDLQTLDRLIEEAF